MFMFVIIFLKYSFLDCICYHYCSSHKGSSSFQLKFYGFRKTVFSRTYSTSRSSISDVRSVCVRLIKHLRNVLSFLSADGQCCTKYMKGGRKRKLTRRREERGETAGKQSILCACVCLCAHECVCVCVCVCVVGRQGDRDHRPSVVDGIWDSLVTSTDIQKHMHRWLPLRVWRALPCSGYAR